jgi:hypothetical protein
MDKPARPLRDIDSNEHFGLSSSLRSAAEPPEILGPLPRNGESG